MAHLLTINGIEKLMSSEQQVDPVFQVLAIKKVPSSSSGTDRHRVLLSDGQYHLSSAMLATQLNCMIESNALQPLAVIKLKKYMQNAVNERKVIILLDIEIALSAANAKEKIGNPVAYSSSGQNNNNNVVKPNSYQPSAAVAAPPRPVPSAAAPMRTTTAPQPVAAAGNFYGQKRAGPNTPGGGGGPVHPIASLTPYQNRWTIKARVTSKGDVKTWSNSRGEGKLFSCEFVDNSGEIRATAFREQVDKFYDLLDIGKVYYVSRAQLKTANKQYSNLKNDYEMTFNNDTMIERCEESGGDDPPEIKYEFVPISGLENSPIDSIVDVVGICKSAGDVATIMTRKQTETCKRDIQLVDSSNSTVQLTLWGKTAEDFDGNNNPVVCVRGARVSDYNGRSLSILNSSSLLINPDIQAAFDVKGWWESGGNQQSDSAQNLSIRGAGGDGGGFSTNWVTLAQMKSGGYGRNDKPDYLTVKGTITFLKKENCMYQACPSESCNKKVIDQGNGSFRCEKCAQTYDKFQYRMMLQVTVADVTDSQWMMCFQDQAEKLLAVSAEDLGRYKEHDEKKFDEVFQEANFKTFIVKMRAKIENYNDEERLKVTCVSLQDVDFVEYEKKLKEDVVKLEAAA